jgi:hypothetical protein
MAYDIVSRQQPGGEDGGVPAARAPSLHISVPLQGAAGGLRASQSTVELLPQSSDLADLHGEDLMSPPGIASPMATGKAAPRRHAAPTSIRSRPAAEGRRPQGCKVRQAHGTQGSSGLAGS